MLLLIVVYSGGLRERVTLWQAVVPESLWRHGVRGSKLNPGRAVRWMRMNITTEDNLEAFTHFTIQIGA